MLVISTMSLVSYDVGLKLFNLKSLIKFICYPGQINVADITIVNGISYVCNIDLLCKVKDRYQEPFAFFFTSGNVALVPIIF